MITRPFGFNVIGHLSDNLGLGVAARSVATLIDSRGMPLALLDLPSGGNRAMVDGERRRFAAESFSDLRSLPYSINLFVIGVDHLRRLQESHPDQFGRDDVLSAALCFWELPTLPPRWIPHLQKVDVIVAASDFIRYAFQFSLSGPSGISARLPITLPPGVEADRGRFDIDSNSVAFVTSFEPYSDVVRKNVAGVIEAFRRGARHRDHAALIVKVNNAVDESGKEHAAVSMLRAECGDDRRIRIVTDRMSYTEVLSLYASADAFISLHRAEGLGLGMAEAMILGKPVIATDWSGNLTFMTHGAGCLVRTQLVAVQGATHIYSEAQLEDTTAWADPDLDHAARWIQLLIDNPDLRKRIGAAASARMAVYNAEAEEAGFLDELHDLWLNHSRLQLPQQRNKGDGSSRRSTVRSSRLTQIQELQRELDWIKSRPSYRLLSKIKSLLPSRAARRASDR